MIEASVINFASILEERIFVSYLLFYSPFYTEGGGISIDQSCSREGKRKKCKKKEGSVARARVGGGGIKVKNKNKSPPQV